MIRKLFSGFLALLPLILPAQKTRILFIGNSYTYVNNLPQTLHDLALSKGDTILFDVSAVGGYRFVDHLGDANTLAKINQQPWDYVVLQEQSQMPAFPPSQVATDVYPYAKRLDSLIHINNSCTETVFYMTWGRKNGDASNCAGYPPICTFAGMNARLRESYLQMSQDNHATASPVGAAWQQVRNTYAAIDLYQADESHPSLQGTYLAASVFYSTLFHKSPVGASFPTGVTNTEAMQLQGTAAATVLDSLANWQQYGDIPNAAFSYTTNGTQVQFSNLSYNATNYMWQFGDNSSSTQSNPSHTYSSNNTFYVSLSASNACRTFSAADTVIVQGAVTGIQQYGAEQKLSITPNPAHNQVTIDAGSSTITQLKIVDALGKTLFYREVISGKEILDPSDWPAAVYYVNYTGGKSIKIIRY